MTQTLPADAVSATFEDTIDTCLKVVSAEFSLQGVTVEQSAVADGTLVKAELTEEQARANQNNELTLTIVAKFDEKVSDADIMAHHEGALIVDNEATVTVNGQGKTTSKVYVQPPAPGEIDITKTMADGAAADQTFPIEVAFTKKNAEGQDVAYTGSVKVDGRTTQGSQDGKI